jgi:MYXO-CTERM domain-containing protein
VFRGLGLLFVVTNGVPSNALPTVLRAAPPTTPCTTRDDCASSACDDGVCCDRQCTRCEACTAEAKGQGADGICGPIVAGRDPHGYCKPTPFACDGMGHCAVAACDGGHTLALQDGSQDCAPYRCSTATNRCLETCASNFDCAEGSACAADGHCGARLEQGASPQCSVAASPRPLPDMPRAFTVAILALSLGRRRRRRRETCRVS